MQIATYSARLLFHCTLAVVVCGGSHRAVCAENVAFWEFSNDMQGWKANSCVVEARHTADGLIMKVESPDPFLTSPRVDCPKDQFVTVSLRMRSTGSTTGQIYFGQSFTEEDSRVFEVINDNMWHEYQITFPSSGPGTRLRFDPGSTAGTVTLASIRVDSHNELPPEKWAAPRELRDKKMIGGGLYTIYGDETAITPGFIAKHPEFADSYPFDGIVIPAPLSAEWVEGLGLTKMGMPWRPAFLNELLWNSIRIPDSAVEQTLADLKSMRRGGLTDNFLICGMVDGARGLKTPELTDDADWAIIEHNAKLAARVCREGRLKGIWLDTEQYGHYRWRTESGTPEFDPDKPQGLHFPLGKDTPELLRRRGAQWIRAVQSEFPEVIIITTFAWSPDSNNYDPLTGVIPFLDGVLAGIKSPARIVHGHENTFYFGHAKGTTHAYATENGFSGDRNRYASARTDIRGWRSLSDDPEKYDRFVQVGMAAWVEDHPWNVPDGWPAGGKASLWSNLSLAMAYTDEYVWVWSEHTKYGQPNLIELNPFLASLNNQTFNTKGEATASFAETFATDPLQRGWYFDFDMLAIGRKADPDHEAAVMSVDSIPYRWDKSAAELQILGESSPHTSGQRRRFVRPLRPEATQGTFRAIIDFRVDHFGSSETNPMVLGLFHSERSIDDHSISLQIDGPNKIALVCHANGRQLRIPFELPAGLTAKQTHRITFDYVASNRELNASLTELKLGSENSRSVAAVVSEAFGRVGADEFGVALSEGAGSEISSEARYRYAVIDVEFTSR
jgi:hypothetical protein